MGILLFQTVEKVFQLTPAGINFFIIRIRISSDCVCAPVLLRSSRHAFSMEEGDL